MCGFDTINEIAKITEIPMKKSKFEGIFGQGTVNRRKSYSFKTTNVHEFKWNTSKKV